MSNFGPDNDLDIDFGRSISFSLDAGRKARLTFSANASWEQALIIYRQATMEKEVEKGTFAPLRNLAPTELPLNNGAAAIAYVVSGWHKRGTPSASMPWQQSSGKTLAASGIKKSVGFDDSHDDHDFNDITVNIEII